MRGLVRLRPCVRLGSSGQKFRIPERSQSHLIVTGSSHDKAHDAVSPNPSPTTWNDSRKYSSSFPHLGLGCGCLRTGLTMQTRTIMTSSMRFSNLPETIISAAATVPVKAPVNVLEYIDSIQQTGKAAVVFSDSAPVLWAVDALCTLKDLPGMTWISTIICGTLIIRTLVGLPVAIIQQKAIGRLELLKPDIQKMTEELKRETAFAIRKFGWDEKTTRIQYKKSFKKHWRKMVEDNNCHPMRSLALSLLQVPFWICFSSALRNIVYAVPLPRTTERVNRWIQIHNESTPWVESLVLTDPVVLPAIFLAASLLNIEYARRQKLASIPETKIQKIAPWIMRGVVVAIALFSTTVPSAVSMYWATSSSLAFAQNVFLRSGTARKLFNLPTIPASNLQKPKPTGKSMEKAL